MAFEDGTNQFLRVPPSGSLDGKAAVDLLKNSTGLIPADALGGYAGIGDYHDLYYDLGGSWVGTPSGALMEHAKSFNLLDAASRFSGATGWVKLTAVPVSGTQTMNAGYWSFNDDGALAPGPYDLGLNIHWRLINGFIFPKNPDMSFIVYITRNGGGTFHRYAETDKDFFSDISRFSNNTALAGTQVINDVEITTRSHLINSVTTPYSYGTGTLNVLNGGPQWWNGTLLTDPLTNADLTPGLFGVAIALQYEGDTTASPDGAVFTNTDGEEIQVNDCGLEVLGMTIQSPGFITDYSQVMMGG